MKERKREKCSCDSTGTIRPIGEHLFPNLENHLCITQSKSIKKIGKIIHHSHKNNLRLGMFGLGEEEVVHKVSFELLYKMGKIT